MIYKIVQGNSFKLHILVRKLDLSMEFQRLIDFDLNQATDIKVELKSSFCDSISVPTHVSGVLGNVLICDIPSTLDIGNYNVKVSWKFDGGDMVSVERNILRIVEHNSQSHLPVGIVEGETTGMYDLRYYVVTSNQSTCPVTFIMDNISYTFSIGGEQKENNPDNVASIQNGKSLEVKLTPFVGFNVGKVKVFMNGIDGTAEYFNKENGKIFIPAVSDYVTIMASGDDNVCYYGSSSAKDMSMLNMDDLTKVSGDLVGKTITIETTDDKPFIWFVSRVPVVFTQGGIEAAMNHNVLGVFYFYWSDELVPGNDNEYSIKLK